MALKIIERPTGSVYVENENETGSDPTRFSVQEVNDAIDDLENRLRSMRSCYEKMRQHGSDLQEALTDFEYSIGNSHSTILNKANIINEKGTLFGIAAHALMNSCENYLSSADSEGLQVVKMLQSEQARRNQLEKLLLDIAKGHTKLEQKTTRFSHYLADPQAMDLSDEEDELSDSEKDEQSIDYTILNEADSLEMIRRSVMESSRMSQQRKQFSEQLEMENLDLIDDSVKDHTITKRRSRVPDRPNISFSPWSILKNNIGKDLSKIPMPVNFNEPLTLLQRLTEELEYADLLDFAAKIEDKCEQLAYVAAFSISIYSSSAYRTGKPFNPLLGETYEFDRTGDLGWRSIAEQVSHHPPISVMHCKGKGWTFWQDYTMTTKFRGKNVEVHPSGSCNCCFYNTGNTYTWGKADTVVNNVIVGKMWIDQQGEVEILGLDASAGVRCKLSYVPYSIFSSELQRRVNGVVTDENNTAKWIIKAVWDLKIDLAPVLSVKNGKKEPIFTLGEFKTIWRKMDPSPDSYKYHNFSKFTCELNELEDGTAPTDSRLRPDLRLMEQGFWDQSNIEKLRLEEQQRKKRKKSEQIRSSTDGESSYQPVWFERVVEIDKVKYVYKDTYWNAKLKQDWSKCPDIF